MPYQITPHPEQLLWVVMEGHLSLPQAECYLREIWAMLDSSPVAQDILVDGRRIGVAAPGARRRTEQIIHHPNLGHLAFVVGDLHLLLLAPLMRLVAGVGLFGDEHAAQAYLRSTRGLPPMVELGLPNMPPPPAELHASCTAAPAPRTLLEAMAPRKYPATPSGSRPHDNAGAAPFTPPVKTIITRRYVGDPHPRPRQLPPPLASRQKHTPLYPGDDRAGSGDESTETLRH